MCLKRYIAITMGSVILFFKDTATTEIYTRKDTLSLHDALPISPSSRQSTGTRRPSNPNCRAPRSEEHTSELQSPFLISYAVFCLKKKKKLTCFLHLIFFIYVLKQHNI